MGLARVGRAVVHRGNAEFSEAGHVGPAELGVGLTADGGQEAGGGGLIEAGSRPGRTIGHLEGVAVEEFGQELFGLGQRAIGGEAEVDLDPAGIGDDVPSDATNDLHRVQTLVVFQPVDVDDARLVAREPVEDVGGVVNGVVTQPGAGRMCRQAGQLDGDPHRALAATLDAGVGRLAEHREIGGQQFWVLPAEDTETVFVGVDLLVVVEDPADVPAGGRQRLRGGELNGHPALHVAGAATPEDVLAVEDDSLTGQVVRERDGIEVAGDNDAFGAALVRPGDHAIAEPLHLQVRTFAEGGLDRVGQWGLVAAHRFDVHDLGEQIGEVRVEIQGVGIGVHGTQPNGVRDSLASMSASAPNLSAEQQARPAWGWGLATIHDSGDVLDTWFPAPELGTAPEGGEAPVSLVAGRDDERQVSTQPVKVTIDLGEAPTTTSDAYLRLHLLSHRLVRPRGLNLDGLFGQLPNVVWTTQGPCRVAGFEEVRGALRAAGRYPIVLGIDKFPRLVDYVSPTGVRIADADRVRLGAHLAEGTTVMHEGFVNFNAGTLGHSMVEGRISQGVTVGDGSDVGGGASIMGTLSGGGTEVVSIGERSLLGANSGLGIALGDDCVVEAGLYVTAGSKVTTPDGSVVKAAELSGQDGLLFIRNSITGAVEVRGRAGRRGVELNADLHAN